MYIMTVGVRIVTSRRNSQILRHERRLREKTMKSSVTHTKTYQSLLKHTPKTTLLHTPHTNYSTFTYTCTKQNNNESHTFTQTNKESTSTLPCHTYTSQCQVTSVHCNVGSHLVWLVVSWVSYEMVQILNLQIMENTAERGISTLRLSIRSQRHGHYIKPHQRS